MKATDSNQNPPARQVRIGGILCDITSDELGFVDINIAEQSPPQELLPEWIVRGALNEDEAIATAEKVIEVRLAGHSVSHDGEGHIYVLPIFGIQARINRIMLEIQWLQPELLKDVPAYNAEMMRRLASGTVAIGSLHRLERAPSGKQS
jgi:hypothetical protein